MKVVQILCDYAFEITAETHSGRTEVVLTASVFSGRMLDIDSLVCPWNHGSAYKRPPDYRIDYSCLENSIISATIKQVWLELITINIPL